MAKRGKINMSVRFGTAGNSLSFASMGYSCNADLPGYLRLFGLDAYEYQCGHGVRISPSSAKAFGVLMKEAGIWVSVHAPYYISLSSVDEVKRLNSVGYIKQTAQLAKDMGAERIVVHSGSCAKISRASALALASETLRLALRELEIGGLSDIHICPETMGKVNQLGTVDEVLQLCSIAESMIPCLDFGHIDARGQGALPDVSSFERVFERVENKLGAHRAKHIHIHFSKIEHTRGGELRHLTFADSGFGANFEDLINVIIKKNCEPVIICESAGTQAEDAKIMRDYWLSL
ncbi:MAG: TIM barrel protein [Oscillospiraceae bacterium]|nr:TIM barrel protein [Oscillospiraceae bacterium]